MMLRVLGLIGENNTGLKKEPIPFEASRSTRLLDFTCVTLYIISAIVFAIYLPILDCDETFNFWEPLHYLLFGWGLQTWEYHPDFALRSWLYIKLHQVLLYPIVILRGKVHKSIYFYSLKIILGLLTGLAAMRFGNAGRQKFGRDFGTTLNLIIVGGVGLYTSGVSFLPSSFSMILQFLSFAKWLELASVHRNPGLDYRWVQIIALNIISLLVGWPFAILSSLPMVIHCIAHGSILGYSSVGLFLSLLILSISVIVDTSYYGKLTFPVFNLIKYNVFPTTITGSHLYGTDPAIFVFKNLFLCFNLVFLAALVSPGAYFFKAFKVSSIKLRKKDSGWIAPATLWLLLLFWSAVPHKEERFFFHLYPYIIFSAAMAINSGYCFCEDMISKFLAQFLYWAFFTVYFGLSIARALALFSLYSAPRELHDAFRHSLVNQNANPGNTAICYSDEWYRFPSSFFLPFDSESVNVAFVKTKGMHSQLPLPFISTSAISNKFNNRNQENSMQFLDVSKCQYFVTSNVEQANRTDWKTFHQKRIVNAHESPWYFRAFYIPYIANRLVSYSFFSIYSLHQNTEQLTA